MKKDLEVLLRLTRGVKAAILLVFVLMFMAALAPVWSRGVDAMEMSRTSVVADDDSAL